MKKRPSVKKLPLAMVLLGHKAGDTVIYSNNGDKYIYYIEEINNNGKIYAADKTHGIRTNIELSSSDEFEKTIDDPSLKVLSSNEFEKDSLSFIDTLLKGINPLTGEMFEKEHIIYYEKYKAYC